MKIQVPDKNTIQVYPAFGRFVSAGDGVTKTISPNWRGKLLDGSTTLSGTGVVGVNGFPASVPAYTRRWRFDNSYVEEVGGSTNYDFVVGNGSPAFGDDWCKQTTSAITLPGAARIDTTSTTIPDINQPGATFSVFARLSIPSVGTNQWLIYQTDTNNKCWSIFIDSGGKFAFPVSANGSAIASYNSTTYGPISGNTYDVGFTISGGKMNAYVNGVLIYGPVGCVTPFNASGYMRMTNTTVSDLAVWKGTALTVTQFAAISNSWILTTSANTYARMYAATPTLTKQITRAGIVTTTSPTNGTWGSETAGQYGYSLGGFRYNLAATDWQASPGYW